MSASTPNDPSYQTQENPLEAEDVIRLIRVNRDQLIENIREEVEKDLVEINHSNLLKNFQHIGTSSSQSSTELQLTNLWIKYIYCYIINELGTILMSFHKGAENPQSVNYGPFGFTTFVKLWKLPFSVASSTDVFLDGDERMVLKGTDNLLTKRLGDINFGEFSNVNYEGYLLKNIEQMELDITDRIRKMKSIQVRYMDKLLTLFALTKGHCFEADVVYEVAEVSEKDLAREFTTRVIGPLVGFISFVFKIKLKYEQDYGLKLESALSGNDPLKMELAETLKVTSLIHAETVVTMIPRSTDKNKRNKKVLLIEHPKGLMVSKMASSGKLERAKAILLRMLSSKVYSKELSCGIVNDIYGSLLVIFDPSKYKHTEDGLFNLDAFQSYQVNDTEFFHQVVNEKQHLNSRILVSMLLYMEIKKHINENGSQEERRNEPSSASSKVKVDQLSHREPLKTLALKPYEQLKVLDLKMDGLITLDGDETPKRKKRVLSST